MSACTAGCTGEVGCTQGVYRVPTRVGREAYTRVVYTHHAVGRHIPRWVHPCAEASRAPREEGRLCAEASRAPREKKEDSAQRPPGSFYPFHCWSVIPGYSRFGQNNSETGERAGPSLKGGLRAVLRGLRDLGGPCATVLSVAGFLCFLARFS